MSLQVFDHKVDSLVRGNLEFHRLNKAAETRLGISLVQYYLLTHLRDRPACSPQALAECAGIHPSTLTQALRRLLKKRTVFVGEDPKDARKKILFLSREGMDLITKVQSEGGDALDSF
jgi:DNA-binding MarR family transcriptional regulator